MVIVVKMSVLLSVFLLSSNLLLLVNGSGFIVNPGPKVLATVGHPWPLPKDWSHHEEFYSVEPSKLVLEAIDGFGCGILSSAIQRYSKLISEMRVEQRQKPPQSEDWQNSIQYLGELSQLNIVLENACEEYPQLEMNEAYSLDIGIKSTLRSPSIWGILRGLETFSQLIYKTPIGLHLLINATKISDEPQYKHRGLLVDTSRHFIHPDTIKKILDGMSYNKLNVFHWHIVDDQSFPFASLVYPELSEKGAYRADLVYTPQLVEDIIEFARMRGIRVIPEFDTPGHTRSWGVAHLELLTKCFGSLEGFYGPMDPTKNSTFHFIENLFREVRARFNDAFFHLGADEVDFECWKSNADIVEYMAKKGYGKDFVKLQDEFVEKVVEIIESLDGTPVVWEEAFNKKLSKQAIVHVWKREDPMKVMGTVTKAGHRAILSTGWYLDRVQFQSDVLDYLKNDPRGFTGSEVQKKLVLGGEACMWSELVDDDNILQRIFSRVAATAERLWSHDFSNLNYALQRIEEHNCRLRARKIPTQPPNGPGFC